MECELNHASSRFAASAKCNIAMANKSRATSFLERVETMRKNVVKFKTSLEKIP